MHRHLVIVLFTALTLVQSGCVSAPSYDPADLDQVESAKTPSDRRRRPTRPEDFERQLGLSRAPSDLGFVERSFNPCNYGLSESCTFKFYTVVQFQILCRDTEGTVSEVPRSLRPIIHPNILWSLNGQSGSIPTDRNGYGRLSVISPTSTRGKRLVLKKGPHYVGLDVSEVSKIVLPKNWCEPS